MLDTLFMQVLDMTKAAGIVILAVIAVRILLHKAPKIFSYILWSVVLFRLLCPITLEIPVSLLPEMASVSENYDLAEEPISIMGASEAAYQAVGDALNGGLGIQHIRTMQRDETGMSEYVSADWWDVWILFGQYVWVLGMMIMAVRSVISYKKLQKNLAVKVCLRDNIYIADDIQSPFVKGIFKPVIYLPPGLKEDEQEYIILHEQCHIKRKDQLFKMLAFLALCIHWFNPLVWLAFVLANKDMEMSCDEAVLKKMGQEIRADYAASLLSLATGSRRIAGMPLAFGEGDTKSRIKNLAKWKKTASWILVMSVIVCTATAVCFLTNPKTVTVYDIFEQEDYTVIEQKSVELTLCILKSELPDSIYTSEGYEFEKGEVVAYQTDTTTIYLLEAKISNESDDELYFVFDCEYKFSKYGKFISPWTFDEKHGRIRNCVSLQSKDLRDGINTYTDALAVRGHGPGAEFVFYVSKDACMSAEKEIMIDIECFQMIYARKGYEEKAAQLLLSDISANQVHFVEMIPTSADIVGAFDSYLYVPVDERTYRYERTDRNINTVTKGDLLYSFTEESDPENVDWKVYVLEEYPDKSAVLVIAGTDYKKVYEYSPSKRCAPDALDQAINAGYVVHVDGDVTSGQEIWENFVDATKEGEASSVQVAMYYTLEKVNCGEEYYEAYKEDYPVLYLLDLSFDGKRYTLKWNEGNKQYIRTYKYLMHYTDETSAAQATSDTYSRYVLVNDKNVTWEEILKGAFSSQFGDYIEHNSVYVDRQ